MNLYFEVRLTYNTGNDSQFNTLVKIKIFNHVKIVSILLHGHEILINTIHEKRKIVIMRKKRSLRRSAAIFQSLLSLSKKKYVPVWSDVIPYLSDKQLTSSLSI